MATITLSAEYGFVGAAILSTGWLNLWQTIKVSRARKLAKIDYPQMYAEKAEAQASQEAHVFNCTQRAHQNTLEGLTNLIAATAFMGLLYPRTAAALCAIWTIGRVTYTLGYSSGKPGNRSASFRACLFTSLGLYLGASWTVVQLIAATLQK